MSAQSKLPAPRETDAALVTRCRAGYPDAFEGLVLRYQNAAFAIALSYLPDGEDAQDLVQDALIDAYCKLEQLHHPERFGGWFRTIVVNHCKTRRRHRQLGRCDLDQAEPQLSRLALDTHRDHVRNQEIWEAVHQLPEPYRAVTLLYYLSGLAQKEIAVFLDAPLSTVKGRLQQAQRRLRAIMASTDATVMAREKETFAMNKIDVSREVQDIVCRIASQPVDQTIPLGDTRHVVLYCGIAAEVEIRQHDGDAVRVNGTKTSIGLSQEAAQQSVRKIEALVDRAEDYLACGPHEGEVFMGTNESDGKVYASKGTTTAIWTGQYVRPDRGWMFNGIALETLYPVLRDQPKALPDEIRTMLEAPVTRVTVLRREVEDLALPVSALTDEVRSVFQINNQTNERVHGGIGYARLTLSAPVGVRITIIGSSHVRATGVNASLILIGCHATLTDIDGEVYLFDSSFDAISGLRGKLWQRFYRYGGSSSAGPQRYKRGQQYECHVRDVTGEVDLDVGRVHLEAENLTGRVQITNRYGMTRLTQNTFAPGSRYWLRSSAGECRVALPGRLIDEVGMTLHTLCGELHFDGLPTGPTGNDTHTMFTSTKRDIRQWSDVLEADFQLQSESGIVAVERLA